MPLRQRSDSYGDSSPTYEIIAVPTAGRPPDGHAPTPGRPPATLPARVANPASRPPTSGPEAQHAAEDYSEIAEPVDDATFEDIDAQTFQKGTLEQSMHLGADGGLCLATVMRTNSLAENAEPADGTLQIAPAIYEYDDVEMSGAGIVKGMLVQVTAIKTALDIDTPAAQMLRVVVEATKLLGLPGTGTIVDQIDAVCKTLGLAPATNGTDEPC